MQDAVVRNLQTIAESTQRLSDALKATEPEIPWRAIARFRNVMVHDYFEIDLEAVWSVVERALPGLVGAVARMEHVARPVLGPEKNSPKVPKDARSWRYLWLAIPRPNCPQWSIQQSFRANSGHTSRLCRVLRSRCGPLCPEHSRHGW